MVAATPQQQQQQQKQAAVATTTVTVAGATKPSAEEEALKRNTDCVYFLASPLTCKKGSECEYRHSEYARVNPRDCYYWLNGNCLNPKCGFRHPPLDGLLGTQATIPTGSSKPSSHTAATTAPASHMPYNQGASYSSSKQAVPCIFFLKGLCIKGDRCAFLHGPTTSNKATQPAATTTASEPHSLKKTFGAVEASQSQKFPPTNVSNTVGLAPESKPSAKVKAAFTRSGTGTEKSVPSPVGLDEELPRHKATKTTSVVNGGSMGHSGWLHQPHASDEQTFHGLKDTEEFLRESSPGFDVLVDDELRDSDFYHGEDQYGGTRGHEGRNVNEYDIGRPANFDAMVDVDQEMFHDARGYDSFDNVQGNYDWDQQRASSERIPLGSSTLERRGYSRVDSPDHVEESDLRHRLSKRRRVNGLKSVVSHDNAVENYEGERNYRAGSHRDSHRLPPNERSLGSRLQGRIKLPGRSVNGSDLHSEREIERGRNWGRHSPGKPQTSSQGRLRDRIKGKVEGDFNNNEGRNFGGPRIRREITDERNADFAGPKSLAELKVGKNSDNKQHQSLGKRRSVGDHQQIEGDLSFKGPMPLSEILKRKRQSEGATSGDGIASVNKEDVDQKQSKGSLISGSNNKEVSVTVKEANKDEESKVAATDIGITEATHGESSQPLNMSEHEADADAEDGIIGDERIEDHEVEADDQRDGEYYYEQVDEGEYNYEVNMDSAAIVWPLFNSLQAFWPGLQVLAGDIDPAIRTHTAFFSVWKRYGFTPEGFNLATLSVQHGQKSYPLRPELIESTYWLYKATRNPRYLDAGRDIVASLQYGARCPCGYCHISDVEFHKREDHMESFFLAETVKYLWLLFDLAVGPDNLVENGPYKYIFSTEGHLLPATPQISLLQEHCSYFGAYCNRDSLKEEPNASDKSADSQETNGSRVSEDWVRTRFPLDSSSFKASPVSGLIKGLCPGLTHEQKYGISYLASVDTPHEDNSAKQKDTVVQSQAIVVVSDQISNQSLSGDGNDNNVKESTERELESDPSQS